MRRRSRRRPRRERHGAAEDDGAVGGARLDPAAPEVEEAALDPGREPDRAGGIVADRHDVAILRDDGAIREPARREADDEARGLCRPLQHARPGPRAVVDRARAERRPVEVLDRREEERGRTVSEDVGGQGKRHAKRKRARTAGTPPAWISASTRVPESARAETTISSAGVTGRRKRQRSTSARTAGATISAATAAASAAREAPGTRGSPGKWPAQSASACSRATTARAAPAPTVASRKAPGERTARYDAWRAASARPSDRRDT